ncbi:hypothetical protein BC936DRAFT_145367 [Jimgerdemannia flammicorona]|uniref:Uncharacterized protein n=1 Tax=Jimgerdemannia flammicorona TaxID=994334 RepID=A0A433DA64_9FUNG|nr:hypothetical protein BC936DRAFT_145367 [Jimgerdemannia flammicorona]
MPSMAEFMQSNGMDHKGFKSLGSVKALVAGNAAADGPLKRAAAPAGKIEETRRRIYEILLTFLQDDNDLNQLDAWNQRSVKRKPNADAAPNADQALSQPNQGELRHWNLELVRANRVESVSRQSRIPTPVRRAPMTNTPAEDHLHGLGDKNGKHANTELQQHSPKVARTKHRKITARPPQKPWVIGANAKDAVQIGPLCPCAVHRAAAKVATSLTTVSSKKTKKRKVPLDPRRSCENLVINTTSTGCTDVVDYCDMETAAHRRRYRLCQREFEADRDRVTSFGSKPTDWGFSSNLTSAAI